MPKLGARSLKSVGHPLPDRCGLSLSAPCLIFLEHILSTNSTFSAARAEVDAAAIAPLPQSRKVYQQGSRPDIRVPFREISQGDTPTMFGGEKNPPLTVYDTSGPYTDPSVKIDIRKGLAAMRGSWIAERDDTEQLEGASSKYGQARQKDAALDALRFEL